MGVSTNLETKLNFIYLDSGTEENSVIVAWPAVLEC